MSSKKISRTIAYDPRRINPLYHIAWGVRFFLSGLRTLIGHPSLFGLSLIPILSTVALLVLIALGSAWLIGEMMANSLGEGLRNMARALIFVLTLMLGYFLYLPIARVLLAPFSEALSRKTHAISNNSRYQSDLGWSRAIWEGLKLVIFQMVIVSIAFIIGLIFPPIGAPVGIALAIFTCGLDFFDVPLSARGLPFRKKLGIIWQNKALAIGFGLAAYISLLIPVINLLSLPVGVIGATLLTDQIEEDGRRHR